jgi:hypothetical protein
MCDDIQSHILSKSAYFCKYELSWWSASRPVDVLKMIFVSRLMVKHDRMLLQRPALQAGKKQTELQLQTQLLDTA